MTLPLTQQVTNETISLRLRELGVSQDSLFYYAKPVNSEKWILYYGKPTSVNRNVEWDHLSAFTCSELGEMLPTTVDKVFHFEEWKTDFDFTIQYKSLNKILHWITEKNEADARGKMLIYLLENSLITI